MGSQLSDRAGGTGERERGDLQLRSMERPGPHGEAVPQTHCQSAARVDKERPGPQSYSGFVVGDPKFLSSMELRDGRQKKTPGIGSPDVELVAGLTSVGFQYSVGYICNAGTQTHTTKEEAV